MNYSKSPPKEELYQLYCVEGLTQKEIARKLKRSERTIRRWLAKVKIPGRFYRGEDNSQYKHGQTCGQFTYRRLRRYLPKACEYCGQGERLVVHHKNNDHYDNVIPNLVILCVSCHSSEHKRMWWAAKKAGLPYIKSNKPLGWYR